MKTCTKCDEPKSLSEFYRNIKNRDSHLNQCKNCISITTKTEKAREYQRKWRKDHPKSTAKGRESARKSGAKDTYRKKWFESNKEKITAYRRTHTALRNGNLIKLPCHICDDPKTEAHHEDYSKPLEVHWLCGDHHRERHAELKRKGIVL